MIRFVMLLLTVSFVSNATTHVDGHFVATKSCPAYISKNKKTNPDELFIHANQRFSIREINHTSPSWIRVEYPDHYPSLRWVSSDCGIADYQKPKRTACDNSPGMADSHVLAFNWQPAFCETHGYEAGKAECLHFKANSYHANHLALHGLWPNQKACGVRYGFCGVDAKSNHCGYSPIQLSEQQADILKQFMPSYAYGSCLERHEWNKHGSCQALPVEQYFSLSTRLANELNQTSFADYLKEHIGDTVDKAQLRVEWANAFGENAHNKLFLGCKNGMLVDVYIYLPALIPYNETLTTLVSKAPVESKHDACPEQIKISDFSTDD